MRDYLQESSRLGRWVGTVLSGVAALLSWVIVVIAVAAVVRGDSLRDRSTTFAVIVILFGGFAIYSSCMFLQLASGRRASNRITVVPAWTIQAFGFFYLGGLLWAAWAQKLPWLAAEGVVVGIAMVFVGRNIEARQRQLRESRNTHGPVHPPH